MKCCPACGKNNFDDFKYCLYCGQCLVEPKTGEAPPEQPEGGCPVPAYEEKLSEYYRPAEGPPPELEPVVFVGFGQAIRSFFRNYARFKGRATRAEFWFGYLFVVLLEYGLALLFAPAIWGLAIGLSSAAEAMAATAMSLLMTVMSGVLFLIGLALLLPMLSLCWRRLHDAGISGGWYFVGLVPFIGAVLLIIWFCMPSDADNRYGLRKTASVMASPAAR